MIKGVDKFDFKDWTNYILMNMLDMEVNTPNYKMKFFHKDYNPGGYGDRQAYVQAFTKTNEPTTSPILWMTSFLFKSKEGLSNIDFDWNRISREMVSKLGIKQIDADEFCDKLKKAVEKEAKESNIPREKISIDEDKPHLEKFIETMLDKELLGEMIDLATPDEESGMRMAREIERAFDKVSKQGGKNLIWKRVFKPSEKEMEITEIAIRILEDSGYAVRIVNNKDLEVTKFEDVGRKI